MERWALELFACPACGASLNDAGGRLSCAGCSADYDLVGGIPDLRLPSDTRSETVRSFYTAAPFPGYPPRDSLSALRARASRSHFAQLLDQAVPGDARVLELGCGTGQMSLFLASSGRRVIGADLTRASLLLAQKAARRFGVTRAVFVETDLRTPGLARGAFDVVYSSGVLHHTPDPRGAFAQMVPMARLGGIIVLGLYNAYARLPHRLRRGVARLTGFRYVPFDPVLRDRAAEPARREAWLRDQYQHPEEHRHTVAEVQRWFAENDVEYLRTYPSTLLGDSAPRGDALFRPAEDNWGLENVMAQLSWASALSHEGGLWITIGRRRGSVAGYEKVTTTESASSVAG
jgi:SAM-dependent methyltransferase